MFVSPRNAKIFSDSKVRIYALIILTASKKVKRSKFRQDQKEALKSIEFFQGEKEENVELLEKYANMETDHEAKNEAPANLKASLSVEHLKQSLGNNLCSPCPIHFSNDANDIYYDPSLFSDSSILDIHF